MKLNVRDQERVAHDRVDDHGRVPDFRDPLGHSERLVRDEVRLQVREEVVYDVAQDDDIEFVYEDNN